MDYGLLNMLGISGMMIFGLWAFLYGYKKSSGASGKKRVNKNDFPK